MLNVPTALDSAVAMCPQTQMPHGMVWTPGGRSIPMSQGGKFRKLDIASGKVETISFTAHVHRTISEMAWSPLPIEDVPFQPKMIRWQAASPGGNRLLFQAVGKLWIMNLPAALPKPLT